MTTTEKIISIDYGARGYDIFIGAGLLFRLHEILPFDGLQKRFFIVHDENVLSYAKNIETSLQSGGASEVLMLPVKSGEGSKSLSEVERITAWALEHKITRDSVMVAVGGGVVGDLAGFCASILLRGVPYIQVPTSLLAQVDSSVGGKTGVNTPSGKNLIGSFYQPAAVIIDIEVLQTLPKREILAGYSEILKYALIGDHGFFNWLEENGRNVCALVPAALLHAIETSVKAKAVVVQSDEREQGARMLLNLGHTFAHALEVEAGYDGRLLHGEAVAIGMLMAFDLSLLVRLCEPEDFIRLEKHMLDIGLLTRASYIQPALDTTVDRLYEAMRGDKKALRDKLRLILVNGIGDAFVSADVQPEDIKAVLKQSLGGLTSGSGIPAHFKNRILQQWHSTQL